MAYLDYNASAPLLPEALKAVQEWSQEPHGNPHSPHRAGRRAAGEIDEAKAVIATLCGVGDLSPEVIFCSGGTMANNTGVLGLARARRRICGPHTDRILVGGTEHPAVLEAAAAPSEGFEVVALKVRRDGGTCLEDLGKRLAADAKNTAAVALMLANNETGILQPVVEASHICRNANVPLHCDAVQAAGKIPLAFQMMGVNTLALAAHKLGGPKGVGALLVSESAILDTLEENDASGTSLAIGTPPVALIKGFEAAAAAVNIRFKRGGKGVRALRQLAGLRDEFEMRLMEQDDVLVVGWGLPRLPNTSMVGFSVNDKSKQWALAQPAAGTVGQELARRLEQAGVTVGTGSACKSGGATSASPALTSMGLTDAEARSCIRVSIGTDTTAKDLDVVFCTVREFADELRAASLIC